MLRLLNKDEINDILYGCTVLGTGGGGDLNAGLDMINDDIQNGLEFKLISLDKIPNNALVSSPYQCGCVSLSSTKGMTEQNGLDGDVGLVAFKTLSEYICLLYTSVHAENADIAEYKTKEYLASGKRDWNVHPLCKPNIVEYEAINRASFLANELDTSMYIFHMSTKEGAEFLIKSKNEGKPIYAEVCAHYLRLTDEVYDRKDGHLYLASPPFRKIDDQKKLWEAISKRAIYTFGSDHAPYTRAQKEMNLNRDGHGKLIPDFTVVDNGLPGIELRLPTLINGVHEGHITWQDLVFVNSYAASRIFGLYPRKGEIVEGADADIVVIDTEREVDINGPESLHMHCNYTPYVGLSFKGWPEITILRGNIIARDGIFVGQRGSGKFLRTNICLLYTSRCV